MEKTYFDRARLDLSQSRNTHGSPMSPSKQQSIRIEGRQDMLAENGGATRGKMDDNAAKRLFDLRVLGCTVMHNRISSILMPFAVEIHGVMKWYKWYPSCLFAKHK
jgi:hypothetical protein